MKYLSNAGLTKLVELINEKFATKTELSGKANSTHTHDYAGSATSGGAATSANKINTDAGSQTQPVYFNNGVPVATKYALNKTVPANALFTDTTYENATTSAAGLMSADDKTKLNGIATNANNYTHPTSMASGSYGPSQNASPAHGGTFSVPYVTVDENGHVSAASTKTITLPADNNTDTKVTNTLGTTTKFYVTGTTSATTNTGTQYFDTGVYVSATAGELVATKFTGALNGKANDSDKLGGTAASNYALKSYVDIKVSDLVGSAPETLDTLGELAAALGEDINLSTSIATQIGSKVTTGSADYIKSASVSGKTLTLTKGDDTTVAFTETDTTYSAGSGLSLSGTTFNHASTVTAGTAGTSSATSGITLAVPYVTYNATGHVTAAGTHTHTVPNMTAASADAAGAAGLVPAPAKGDQAKFLRADGTWQAANNYSHPNSGVTAGTYGPSEDVSGSNGTKINVPEIVVNAAGHITSISNKEYTSVDHTYSNATTSAAGLMSADDKTKLNGIAVNANNYTHPNTVTAGTVGTSSATNGVTLAVPYVTYNANGHITATGTHTHTVSGMTGASADAAGATGLVPAPAKGDQAKFLRADGTWQAANNYSHPSDGSNTGSFGPSANASPNHGAGFSVPYITVNAAGHVTAASTKTITLPAQYSHPTSGVTAASYGPTDNASPAHGGTFSVPSVTVDANGHITAASTKTITLPADNNTDTKVTNTLGTTTKFYVTGTTSATTNTGTQYFDTGVYVSATAGELVATKFTGNLTGNVTGNCSGTAGSVAWANVTGKPSTFSPATHTHNYAGSASAGGPATEVQGTASAEDSDNDVARHIWYSWGATETKRAYDEDFTYNPVTNNLTVGKINGVEVGSTPKFTDTVYTHPNSGATAGSYGPSANASPAHGAGFSVPYLTINAAGHITAASTKTITLPAQYSHPASGATAGSYGPSANASPAHSGTFSVPYITVDANGHVTAASTKTITLPADNNTDTKVTNTLATTTKAYITGTTSTTTNTGTQVFDTGVYLSTTAGELVATKFTGALNGKANDSDKLGGTAASSYALKSYVDTAVANIVNSAPETLDTLSELSAALGDDPNFATTIATQIGGKVATGSADYIKSASVSGKTLTLTKGDDTTVAFTETNTTYSAGSGLSLSGTTFNHASTVTAATAGTSSATSGITLAVPYVTYNGTGHITAAGTHTHTVPTFTKSGTSAAAGLVPAPSTTAGTTKYLREDGTWTVPPNDNTVYSHPSDGANTGSFGPSANASPAHGGTFSVPYITVNSAGHVTAASTKTITLPADNDTKNTAGSTNSTAKLFLVGAASQAANPQTYSSSKVYETDGALVATSFAGSGASLTALNASNISSGTLAAARLATSGATAGSYGESADKAPGYAGTFNIPYVTVDTYGRVTAIANKKITLPSADNTDTKNTAGSTDTSSKIFLIGATSQAANPQTYSDNEIYATSGVLTTKSVQVGGTACTLQYNATNKCVDFVFAA